MKKVLVVDDSKTIRTICQMIYKGLSDQLIAVESADEARKAIEKESPDVVIVDYTLPDTDSYEFVSSLKGKASVIFMGGSFAPFDEEKAKAAGAVAVLMKPFKSEEFFGAIKLATGESVQMAAVSRTVAAMPPVPPEARHASHSDVSAVPPANVNNAVTPVSGVRPIPAGASSRRFNFPGNSDSGVRPVSPQATEGATPKSPVPSVSPAAQIDPAVIRAEVIAAVKSLLPGIVNSYLKKLIQMEVRPQLQSWVDSRVEALVKKMTNQ